jgi:hypothetical protein
MTASVCRQCSADTSVTRLGRLEGADGGITTAIVGLPIYDCVNGHKRFLTPEFPLQLIDSLLKSDALAVAPQAVQKGLFRKHQHCPACGKELPEQASSKSNMRKDVELPDAEPILVEVELPLYQCPACKQEVTLPKAGVERAVMQAVANAFRSADIPPG